MYSDIKMDDLELKELLILEENIYKEVIILNDKLRDLRIIKNKINSLKLKKCKHIWVKIPQYYDRPYDECKICNCRTC